MDRRQFLKGASALAGAHILGGCGMHELGSEIEPVGQSGGIHEGASAYQFAVRGEQFQITPPPPPPVETNFAGTFVLRVDTDEKLAAISIDDGPSPHNTPPILETAKRYGAFVTFYVIGVNVIAFPELVIRAAEEGHEIANHTQDHYPYIGDVLGMQLSQCQATVRNLARGYEMKSSRAAGFTRGPNYMAYARASGLYEVHTTLDSLDWESQRKSKEIVASNVLGPFRQGDIPLFHDGGGPRPTPGALEIVIPELIRRGYQLVTVSELMRRGNPNPGTPNYAPLRTGNLTSSALTESTQETSIEQNGLACNYDPEKELLDRYEEIKDGPTNADKKKRSQIADALDEYYS